jgi:hypothetical protein
VLVRPQAWQVMETNEAVVMAGSFRLASRSARALSRVCRWSVGDAGSGTAGAWSRSLVLLRHLEK